MDFIHLIEELTGNTATIERSAAHVADMHATWADISKAKKILDWAPAYGFRHGVEELVRWYHDNRSWTSEIQTGS